MIVLGFTSFFCKASINTNVFPYCLGGIGGWEGGFLEELELRLALQVGFGKMKISVLKETENNLRSKVWKTMQIQGKQSFIINCKHTEIFRTHV